MRRDVYDFLRHIMPDSFSKWISRYNFEGGEIQSLQQEVIPPFTVVQLDLSVARAASDPYVLKSPGRCFVFHGFTTGSSTQDAAVGAFIQVRVERDVAENTFFAKHNRGFRGDFTQLFLSWPAQASTTANFYVLKFDDDPWQQDSQFGATLAGGATEATLSTLNNKFTNNYGAATGAVRIAAQIGNTTGASDFGAGASGAQTLRVSANILRDGNALSYNAGTSDANTQRVSANITRNGTELSYNAGASDANTPRVSANITRNGTELSYNAGASDANTPRVSNATQSGTVTQAAVTVGTTALRCTVSGSAPNAARKKLLIQPDPSSTATFYIGSSTVANSGANRGIIVQPGQIVAFDLDSSDYYIIASAASQTFFVSEVV